MERVVSEFYCSTERKSIKFLFLPKLWCATRESIIIITKASGAEIEFQSLCYVWIKNLVIMACEQVCEF